MLVAGRKRRYAHNSNYECCLWSSRASRLKAHVAGPLGVRLATVTRLRAQTDTSTRLPYRLGAARLRPQLVTAWRDDQPA